MYCEDTGYGFNTYHYEYTWLAMDMTDNDEDGVLDFMETQGILGTNGQIYISNPTQTDTDDDTIIDKEEIGIVYYITRGVDGRNITVRIDNEIVFSSEYGVIPPESPYYFLNAYFDNIPNGSALAINVPLSDPSIPDSDGDGCKDSEDARPIVINPIINYLITSPELTDDSLYRLHIYEEHNMKFVFLVMANKDSFVLDWNGIGLFYDYYNSGFSKYGSKYYYTVQNVVVNAHGTPQFFEINVDEFGHSHRLYYNDFLEQGHYTVTMPKELMNKTIDRLVLLSCWTGFSCETMNVAQSFADIDGVNMVIAPDSELYSYIFSGCDMLYCYRYIGIVTRTQDDYVHLVSSARDDRYRGSNVYCENYNLYENTLGFVAYVDDNDPYDLYSDDVICGVLHSTQTHINNQECGVIVTDYCVYDQSDIIIDPVLR